MNHWYLVSAHVIEPELREEKFTSLSYAGFLPGYTMGYNHHGLVYTINTLSAKFLRSGKTRKTLPIQKEKKRNGLKKYNFNIKLFFFIIISSARYFLTRALLGVENYVQAQETLRNVGYGAAEGFSVNMTFLEQEGDRMFHNAEVGPAEPNVNESQLSILTASPGENIAHCNK